MPKERRKNKFFAVPKTAILFFLILFAESTTAQDGTIYPLDAPAEPTAIPLGTGGVENQPASETWFRQWGDPMARNITTATLTPFFPKPDKANGATVIVAPGGGFRWLSMGNEGWEVAEALAAQGVTAFVLKYRLHPTPVSLDDFSDWMKIGIVDSWYKAGIPVEFHLYQNGGHGFGLGNPNRTSNRWFDAFMHWLDVNGFLAAKSGK